MNEFKNTTAVIQEDVISQRIRIEQLEAQIEKMKCCGNCKNASHCDNNLDEEYSHCEYWELAE